MMNRSFDYRRRLKQLGISTFIGIPILGWGLVLGVKGDAGPYGWWLLMAFGLIGIGVALGCLICQGIKMVQHKRLSKIQTGILIWSLVVAWPGFWPMGVGQVAYPVSLNAVGPSAVVSLPLETTVQTLYGGDALSTNHHSWMPAERWAYDFAIPIQEPPGASLGLSDYPIFGERIFAPADGIIVDIRNTEQDIMPDAASLGYNLGNYVIIKMDQTETYLVLAHLKQNSIPVVIGDRVQAGTFIGRVGNSGTSSEPHLHIHHQRQNPVETPVLFSEGLPLYFMTQEGKSMPLGGYLLQGGESVPNGDWVSPLKVNP